MSSPESFGWLRWATTPEEIAEAKQLMEELNARSQNVRRWGRADLWAGEVFERRLDDWLDERGVPHARSGDPFAPFDFDVRRRRVAAKGSSWTGPIHEGRPCWVPEHHAGKPGARPFDEVVFGSVNEITCEVVFFGGLHETRYFELARLVRKNQRLVGGLAAKCPSPVYELLSGRVAPPETWLRRLRLEDAQRRCEQRPFRAAALA